MIDALEQQMVNSAGTQWSKVSKVSAIEMQNKMLKIMNNEQKTQKILNIQASMAEREASIDKIKNIGVFAKYYSYTRSDSANYQPSIVKIILKKNKFVFAKCK